MPDQSSAADEHALMQEITAPLEKLPDNPVPMAADVKFPLALRGYDRIAVDAYVRKTSEMVAELQATRSPDSVVRRALERVGEEVSGILQRAHETSDRITAQSRREAEDRLEQAREEAAKVTADAQVRLKDLDHETDRIWAERLQIVEDTRELARQLLMLADSATERFPAAEEQAVGPAEEGDEALDEADEGDGALEAGDLDEEALAGGPAGQLVGPERERAPGDVVGPEGERSPEQPVESDPELPDNDATAVLPSVSPAEPDEQHR